MEERSNLGILAFVAVVLLGFFWTRDPSLNRQAPEFSLPESYGGRVDLASYRGRPVLLVFWTTSCGICRHELPLLNQLAPEFASKGIAVVTVLLGGKDEARSYLSANHLDLTAVVDSDGAVAGAYHVNGVPRLVLITKDGKVKRAASGWTDESTLRDWMDAVSGS